MKFSPKCRTKKLEMICIRHFGKMLLILNWEGALIRPLIKPSIIPAIIHIIVSSILTNDLVYSAVFDLLLIFSLTILIFQMRIC